MTNNPILHPLTSEQLQTSLRKLPQSLLLSGAAGIGKTTVAQWYVKNVLNVQTDLESHPYILQITPIDGRAIGIESVRQIEHFTSLKIPNKQQINRVIIIHDAHLLTTEAQNALLKILEEPPQATMLLLTAVQTEALLPTVRSRLQSIAINKPTLVDLHQSLALYNLGAAELKQILALSDGLPGLAHSLAQGDQSHPLVAAAQDARQLLMQTNFEKLCQVDRLSKNTQAAHNILTMLGHMSRAALLTGRSTSRWQKVMTATYLAESDLQQGTQTKLVLTNLMLNL